MKVAFRYFFLFVLLTAAFSSIGGAQDPVTITSASPLPSATVGVQYSFQFQATGGVSPPYIWDLTDPFSSPAPPGLTLDFTGILEGVPLAVGQFSFDVSASDSMEQGGETRTFVLNVLERLAIVTPSPLPAGTAGQPYQAALAATGGAAPYFWRVLAGQLPPGYFIDSRTGEIRGVTAQPGAFVAEILVRDSEQRFATKSLSLTVQAAPLGILPDPPLPPAFVGQAYALSLIPTSGNVTSWSLIAGSLAPGLTLGSTNGQISGAPSKAGTFVWTVLAVRADGATAVREYSIQVQGDPAKPPAVDFSLSPLSFNFSSGSDPAVRGLQIRNTGSGIVPVSLQAGTQNGGGWLSVTPSEGVVTAAEPLDVLVRADPSGLDAGSFFGSVNVTSDVAPSALQAALQQSAAVPVALSISSRSQFLRLSFTGLTFTAVQGGGNPPALPFDIINDGSQPMLFTAAAAAVPSAPWLRVSAAQGTVNAKARTTLSVAANPGNLIPGVHFGVIEVQASGAAGEVRLLTVVLNLLPAGSRPPPVVDPLGMLFAGTAGGAAPKARTVVLSNVSATPVDFSSVRFAEGIVDAFSHSPATGRVNSGEPLEITIQPNTSGLEPGVYRSLLRLTFTDGTRRTISLVLVVGPAQTSTLTRAAALNGCPSKLEVAIASFSGGYPSYVDAPAFLRAEVADDCGQPFVNGSGRSVRAESAGRTVFLEHKGSGTWEATLDFQISALQAVEVKAQDISRSLLGQATTADNIQPSLAGRPKISAGGVLQGASFSAAPMAPGSIISIFGEGQSTSPTGEAATTLPLPQTLAGTRVRAGGVFLPLFYASANQVNASLPLSFGPDSGPLSVIVFRGSVPSDPEEVQFGAARPGLFTLNASGSGEGIFQDVNFRLISNTLPPAQNPGGRTGIKPGEPVILYATGLGAVTPPVPAGQPAPADPLSTVNANVELTIGGQPAVIGFKGLTPGFVGFYQVNAIVPAGLAPGNAEVILTVDGVRSPPGVTLSIE